MPLFKTKTEKKEEAAPKEYVGAGPYPTKQKATVFLEKSPVVGALLAGREEKKEKGRLRAFTETFEERVPSPVVRRSAACQRVSAFSRKAWSRAKDKAGAFKFYMMTGSRTRFWFEDIL